MALAVSLPVGFKVLIHSNPQDVGNHPVTPSPAVSWTTDRPDLVSLSATGIGLPDCWVTALAVGSAKVTMTSGSVTNEADITVTPSTLDHFSPTNDPPVPA